MLIFGVPVYFAAYFDKLDKRQLQNVPDFVRLPSEDRKKSRQEKSALKSEMQNR